MATALLVGCLALGAAAAAAGDDRAIAEAVLKEVAASPRKDVAKELVARSQAALDRATRLRGKGDEKHAVIADGAARGWAEAAREAVKAASVEEAAAKARNEATDAGLVADRERALLEEAVAQSGRLRAQLESGAKDKETPARTSAQATADGGAKAPPKPAKPGGAKGAPANLDGGAP